MKYFIFTLGCQMNRSDSERIATVLESQGLKSVPMDVEADLIIVNSCSVRQSAVDRIWGKLKIWKKFPHQPINKLTNKLVFITGCVLPADKKKFESKVDAIFPISDLPKLPQYLKRKRKLKILDYFQIPVWTLQKKDEIFIPIMTGCDNFCSYCAVPLTRGREYSRETKDIICEVENAVKKGFKTITLLGQNVNSFKPNFVKLLKVLVQIPSDFQIKFMSSNPQDFPDKLVELVAREPKISKEIHLPVQSGDDEILRKMNRKYTTTQYLKIVSTLRSQVSNLYLTSDLIVGFPGETKKAFQNTVNLCKKIKFNKAYIAQYSPRPGTVAAQMKDSIPKDEKKRRWKILDQLINKKPK